MSNDSYSSRRDSLSPTQAITTLTLSLHEVPASPLVLVLDRVHAARRVEQNALVHIESSTSSSERARAQCGVFRGARGFMGMGRGRTKPEIELRWEGDESKML